MTTGKHAARSVRCAANLTCLGFDRVERSYQPRFIALSIVPGHFKDHRPPEGGRYVHYSLLDN
jgi:hypothetical protein